MISLRWAPVFMTTYHIYLFSNSAHDVAYDESYKKNKNSAFSLIAPPSLLSPGEIHFRNRESPFNMACWDRFQGHRQENGGEAGGTKWPNEKSPMKKRNKTSCLSHLRKKWINLFENLLARPQTEETASSSSSSFFFFFFLLPGNSQSIMLVNCSPCQDLFEKGVSICHQAMKAIKY